MNYTLDYWKRIIPYWYPTIKENIGSIHMYKMFICFNQWKSKQWCRALGEMIYGLANRLFEYKHQHNQSSKH